MPFETPTAAPAPPTSPAPRAVGAAVRVEGRPGGRSELDKPLKLPASPDFYLIHHPNGWALEKSDDGYELLPTLKEMVLLGGINRVMLTPNGPDSGLARTKLRDSGWTVLEDQDEYRVLVDVKDGVAHRLRWDVIHRYPDGSSDVQFDRAGWLAWRRSLVERGVVAPPRPAVVRQLRARLERRIGRRGANLHIPAVQVAQERDEAALAGLDSATGGGDAPVAPAKPSHAETAAAKSQGAKKA